MRNIHVRALNSKIATGFEVVNAMAHAKSRMIKVRTAVARFESTPVTPILAKIAVRPAKNADKIDQ